MTDRGSCVVSFTSVCDDVVDVVVDGVLALGVVRLGGDDRMSRFGAFLSIHVVVPSYRAILVVSRD